jgi:hypothetical protein
MLVSLAEVKHVVKAKNSSNAEESPFNRNNNNDKDVTKVMRFLTQKYNSVSEQIYDSSNK